MSNKNLKQNAFPIFDSAGLLDGNCAGLTKHEYAAIKIMTAIAGDYNLNTETGPEQLVNDAYSLSQQLLNKFK